MPTISDVAKRAGVSTVTVSRVINDEPNVSAATRQRVVQAIEELRYVPNVVARSLRSKRTFSLALIVPDITNAFWTTVARGVEDVAQSRGYSVLLCNTDENPAKQRRYLQAVTSQRVDGAIIAPYDADARNLHDLRSHGIPTVLIDRHVAGWDGDSVFGDSVSGARALVRHLIAAGYRRIAAISGPPNASTADDRVNGYCLALEEAGIPVEARWIKRGEYRAASGEQLTYQLLDQDPRPEAIFAANNAVALGVIEAVKKRGLRIPHDLALVCFDDLPETALVFPFLTVVVQPAYDMGMHAAQLLLSRLDAEAPLQPRRVVLPTRLVVRYSCGSRLAQTGAGDLSLPLVAEPAAETYLVKPLQPGETVVPSHHRAEAGRTARPDHQRQSDAGRLLAALQGRETGRLPYLQLEPAARAVCEYVLQRELRGDAAVDRRNGQVPLAPEDVVEFAGHLGIDGVVCHLSPWSAHSVAAAWADPAQIESAWPPAAQLGYLERYLRAAHGSGVAVAAGFEAFCVSPGIACGTDLQLPPEHRDLAWLERLLERSLRYQEKIVRVVCDRFGNDLAFVAVTDRFLDAVDGVCDFPQDAEDLRRLCVAHVQRLIAPAREHGKPVMLHTTAASPLATLRPGELDLAAVHLIDATPGHLAALKSVWGNSVVLAGNIPGSLLAAGSAVEIESAVRELCATLAPDGGILVSPSQAAATLPGNFVAMLHTAQEYCPPAQQARINSN